MFFKDVTYIVTLILLNCELKFELLEIFGGSLWVYHYLLRSQVKSHRGMDIGLLVCL